MCTIGWQGISIHPTVMSLPDDPSEVAYNSYNLNTMIFHLQPVPVPAASHVLLISPLSGHCEYKYDYGKGRWLSEERHEHDLEGMLVRDMLRVFGGCLKL